MKTVLLSLVGAVALGGVAFADEAKTTPTVMTDAQMDQIVAGNHVIRLIAFRNGITTEVAREN